MGLERKSVCRHWSKLNLNPGGLQRWQYQFANLIPLIGASKVYDLHQGCDFPKYKSWKMGSGPGSLFGTWMLNFWRIYRLHIPTNKKLEVWTQYRLLLSFVGIVATYLLQENLEGKGDLCNKSWSKEKLWKITGLLREKCLSCTILVQGIVLQEQWIWAIHDVLFLKLTRKVSKRSGAVWETYPAREKTVPRTH